MSDILFDLPHGFSREEWDSLLIHAYDLDVSDVRVQPGVCVHGSIHGRMRKLTHRPLQDNEVRKAMSFMYGDNATAILSGGSDIDLAYEIAVDKYRRIGFRVNATPGYIVGGVGAQIVLRRIPGEPPRIQDMDLPAEILEGFCQIQGMVLVVGVTGSGKSTLLASRIRYMLEEEEDHSIVTFESPIEFVFANIKPKSSLIWQTEVPSHLRHPDGFAYCVRNSLRRAPTDIFIGEARDRETIYSMIEASLTGHATYATVHADSVASTISRLVLKFPPEIRDSVTYDLLSVLKMIVVQKLLPSVDGKRVAVREYLVFDKEARDRLMRVPTQNLVLAIGEMVEERGSTMFHSVRKAFDAGLITRETFEMFRGEVKNVA